MKEIIFAGFGGQGVLTAGLIMGYIANSKGLDVSWMPAYGPTKRGGKANSVVKFGDVIGEEVGSPVMEEADVLVAMNEPSLDYIEFCRSNAVVFVNSQAVPDDYKYPEGLEIVKIDAVKLSESVNNKQGANLVMLGACIGKLNLFEEEYAESMMCKFFEDKNKGKANAVNRAAMRLGFAAV